MFEMLSKNKKIDMLQKFIYFLLDLLQVEGITMEGIPLVFGRLLVLRLHRLCENERNFGVQHLYRLSTN